MSEIFNEWKKIARPSALNLQEGDVSDTYIPYLPLEAKIDRFKNVKSVLKSALPETVCYLVGLESDTNKLYVKCTKKGPSDELSIIEDFKIKFGSKIIKDQTLYPSGLESFYYEAFLLM